MELRRVRILRCFLSVDERLSGSPDLVICTTRARVKSHARLNMAKLLPVPKKPTPSRLLVDIPGPVGVIKDVSRPKKVWFGCVIVGLSVLVRIKKGLSEIRVSKSASQAVTFIFHVVVGQYNVWSQRR